MKWSAENSSNFSLSFQELSLFPIQKSLKELFCLTDDKMTKQQPYYPFISNNIPALSQLKKK